MAMNKKVQGLQGMESGALLEVREVDVGKPPVYLLSRLQELKAATALSELGALSFLEEKGAFSFLEEKGAFSTAEKLLPTVEKLGL